MTSKVKNKIAEKSAMYEGVGSVMAQTELGLSEMERALDAGYLLDAGRETEDAKPVGAHPVRDSGYGLPEGWGIESLEALTSKIGSGSTPKGGQKAYLEEGTPLIRSMNIHFDRIKKDGLAFISDEAAEKLKNVEVLTSDVLLNITGASIGRVNIATDEYSGARVNQHVAIIRMLNGMSAEYVYYYLRTPKVQSYIHSNESGATRQALTKDKIASFEIPLPPLAEQTVIAQTLDTLLAQVDNIKTRLDAIPNILKTFRQSVLAAAVSGKLTEAWRGENEKPFSSWKELALNKCFECIDGDRGPNYPKKEEYLHEGYCLFLSTKNVRPYGFDFSRTVFISEEKDQILRKGRMQRGDIVITTRGTLGYVASYDDSVDYEVIRINSGMLILRKKDESFVNDYFKILIASPKFQKEIDIQRTGSAQPQLPAKILKEFLLNVPPAEEQTEIVRRVEELFAFADQIEQQVKNAQGRVNNLTQSILAKAFRGELTTQWRAENPDLISGENSAEALLAKIQAERDALKKSSKPKKKSTAKKTTKS